MAEWHTLKPTNSAKTAFWSPPSPNKRYEGKKGKSKQLCATTLKDILESAEALKSLFAGKRVLEVTSADINRYLDDLKVGLRRKFNVRGRLSQFSNWCIAHGHMTNNPRSKART